ncbi:MAG: fructose-1,6-bisphosphatase [Lachnospiraceae bacterium]
MEDMEIRYLRSLARQYPTIASAATEIINLKAILSLPKGTEHFITDIHGEYDQFQHIIKNGSGAIRKKIEDEFGNAFSASDKKELAALIYYPEQKLNAVLKKEENIDDWYTVMIYRLIQICKAAASKYTRSKVRKAMQKDFAYVIEELMSGRPDISDQEAYYREIVHSVISTGRAQELIIALANLCRRLVVDHLHVVGDVYDRGPYPHLVMDALMEYHSVDFQWGNHDVLWMGAGAGDRACISNVIRIAAKYGNLDILEDGYGINLVPLAGLAMHVYEEDACDCFKVDYRGNEYIDRDALLDEKIHKAIAVIQFKLEGEKILRNPTFDMEDRLLLDKINWEEKTVQVYGKTYPIKESKLPTIDPSDPYKLSKEESDVMDRLKTAFLNCERLQRHIRFMFAKGSLYKVYNGNLLYHGCVPLTESKDFAKVNVFGEMYSGKALYDVLETYARKGYYSIDSEEKQRGLDTLWFIWENKNSPVFGKEKMTTFERYFIQDKETHKEPKNTYYSCLNDEATVNKILEEFGLPILDAHIINGHIPVEAKKGESPVKCDGKLLIIDGGFSKAYQSKTGIAGYTLIYNSYGLVLAAHEPFESVEKAVQEGSDVHSHTTLVQHVVKRKTVADTDIGARLKESVDGLESLLAAYRKGIIVEAPL